MTERAFDGNIAAQQVGKMATERQAQSRAAILARGGRISLTERLEEIRHLFGRDANAGIPRVHNATTSVDSP